MAFLGDDYTVGTGASVPAKRFSTLASVKYRFSEKNFGEVGTGYAKQVSGGAGAFNSRITAVAASHPNLVIVSGGRNDVTDDLSTLATRVTQFFADLRAALPHAVITAMAPIWGDSPAPSELRSIAASVKLAVEAVHGAYLDLSDPLTGNPTWMADQAHPNDTGYAHIAAELDRVLGPYISMARSGPSSR